MIFSRVLLRAWAKSGKAPGRLYEYLEHHGGDLSSKPIVRTLRCGLRLKLDLRDHVQRQIYFFGAYEPIELSLFLRLLQPGFTAIDGGANVGFYSLMMAQRVGRAGRVLAFEAVPDTFSRLEENIALNDLPQLSPVNHALWSERQTLEFSLSKENEHNVGGYSFAASRDAVRHARCSGMRLDDFAKETGIGRVDAIKMDIEGAERFALEGSREIVTRDRPVFLLEVSSATCARAGYLTQDLWEFFDSFGYRACLIGATFEESDWTGDFSDIQQSNVLLIPPDQSNSIGAWNDKHLCRQYL